MTLFKKRLARKAMARAQALALVVPVTQRRYVPNPSQPVAWDAWGSAL